MVMVVVVLLGFCLVGLFGLFGNMFLLLEYGPVQSSLCGVVGIYFRMQSPKKQISV